MQEGDEKRVIADFRLVMFATKNNLFQVTGFESARIVPRLIVDLGEYKSKACSGAKAERRWRSAGPGLVDVLPVFLFQQIGQPDKHQDEEQHVFTHRLSFQLHRFSDINQKINQIVDHSVELLG